MHVPVLVVGGGACGLSMSIFLSDLGVNHLMVERHSGTAVLPKAGSYTQRTMEIFRRHGVADEIYRLGPEPEQVSKVAFYTSLSGDGPLDAKRLHIAPFLGFAEPDRSVHERDSPARCAILPQWDLEPVLREAAEKRNPGGVRFNYDCVSIEDEGEQVRAVLLNTVTGVEEAITADYVVAADGGRSIGPRIGMVPTGSTGLADMVSLIFEADLSELMPEDDVMIWFFVNPEGGPYSSGVLVPQGSADDGWVGGPRDVRRWRLNVRFATGDPAADLDEESAERLVRKLLHVQELPVSIIGLSHWSLEAVLAEKFRVGRFFLAGDAAHRQPPTTGLGLNSAIQDAHNLAWKLAAVTSGSASDVLLDSYESERRPVDERQVEWAMFTFQNLGRTLVAGLGVGPEMSMEQRQDAFTELLSDTAMGITRRALLNEVWQTQRIEFNPHDLDLGYCYGQGGALVPDGSDAPPRDPMGVEYVPAARPGHRLPHVWLRRQDERVSIHDLVPLNGFALVTSDASGAWESAAGDVADRLGIRIDTVSIGAGEEFYEDESGRWMDLRGTTDTGAVLVRPDGFVGWRSEMVADPVKALFDSVSRILCTEQGIEVLTAHAAVDSLR